MEAGRPSQADRCSTVRKNIYFAFSVSCLDGDNDKVAGISEIWSFEFTVKCQHSGGR